MYRIEKDIERERLLKDCNRLQWFRGEDMEIERVIDICLDEDMAIEDICSIIMDNCLVVQDCLDAIDYISVLNYPELSQYIEYTLETKIKEMPMSNIR